MLTLEVLRTAGAKQLNMQSYLQSLKLPTVEAHHLHQKDRIPAEYVLIHYCGK